MREQRGPAVFVSTNERRTAAGAEMSSSMKHGQVAEGMKDMKDMGTLRILRIKRTWRAWRTWRTLVNRTEDLVSCLSGPWSLSKTTTAPLRD